MSRDDWWMADGCHVQTGLSCNKSHKTDFFKQLEVKFDPFFQNYYKGASEGPGDPHHWKTIHKCNGGNKIHVDTYMLC